MGKCCSKRQEPQPIGKFKRNEEEGRILDQKTKYLPLHSFTGYTKAETGLSSKHSNGGSLDRYTADPNQRGVQARADIIRPRPTPCKLQIQHHPRKTSSPVVTPACVYYFTFSFWFILFVDRTSGPLFSFSPFSFFFSFDFVPLMRSLLSSYKALQRVQR